MPITTSDMVSSSMGDIHSSTCEVSPQQQQQQQSSLKNSSIESLNIATQIVSNKQPQPMKHVTSVEFQKIPDAALVKNMPAIQVSNFEEVMLMKQSTLPPPPPPTPLPLPIVSTTDEVKPQLSTSNSTTTTTNHNRDDIFINEIKVTPVRETEVDKKLNSLVETLEKTRHTTGEAGRKRIAREKARALANVLTAQGETVEHNASLAEKEVFFKAEESFFAQQDKQEISQTLARQAEQVRRLKMIQESHAKDRIERKQAKNFQRNLFRERKEKDGKIHAQELAHKVAAENKQMLKEQHERIQQLVEYTSEKHQKERRQLSASQDRKINDQKRLLDIQTDKMGEDEKNEVVKEFQLGISHQKTLNKKVADQLRERQVVEMRQLKERADLDTQIMLTLATLKAQHTQNTQRQELSATQDISRLKNTADDLSESIKINQIKLQHVVELDKLASLHKQQYQNVMHTLKNRSAKRRQKWSKILGRDIPKLNEMFTALDQEQQRDASADGGDVDNDDAKSTVSSSYSTSSSSRSKCTTSKAALVSGINEAIARAKQELVLLEASLTQEAATRIQTLANLRLTQHQALSDKEAEFEKQIIEMEQLHEQEMNELVDTFEEDVSEVQQVQEREREMEAVIRNAETKALQERKVLTAILNTTVDGVISIDPTGFIKRFNTAAEKMFGYSSNEIIDRNIKELMPANYAANHDDYLYNYLKTGEKKVIGKGRHVLGKKKDGSTFPIHLSISEVIEDGFHLFTGIVRDLTEVIKQERHQRQLEDAQKAEAQALIDDLAVARSKSEKLLRQMLPGDIPERIMRNEAIPAQSFEKCTIFFSDIVGFTSIASAASAMDIVNLLNDMYTYFDSIIEKHDVYKVETIGDAYMVVSGVPESNERHACEIADMSLELLSGIYSVFKVRHLPGQSLQIRIGIHSGSCMSGIVGTKMPRYCLFGDTVSTASRMESSGSPMRIQCSFETYILLRKAGGYRFEERIDTHSDEKTFWLVGKDRFRLPLPETKDWPVIGHVKG